jgi:hypothetical protein
MAFLNQLIEIVICVRNTLTILVLKMRASIKDIEMQKYFIMKKKLKKQKLT